MIDMNSVLDVKDFTSVRSKLTILTHNILYPDNDKLYLAYAIFKCLTAVDSTHMQCPEIASAFYKTPNKRNVFTHIQKYVHL